MSNIFDDQYGYQENCDCTRLNREPSLYDTDSRDSGFEEHHNLNTFGTSLSVSDENFLEEFSEIQCQRIQNLPADFDNLIHKPFTYTKYSPANKRQAHRRSLSLQDDNVTPKVRRHEVSAKDENNFIIKRTRILFNPEEDKENISTQKNNIQRSFSATEESIMCAVQKSSTQPDLIGDCSKSYCLPLIKSKHDDLKAIDAKTLAELINGKYYDTIASFKIIDCRYPYEYQGGHISGAINIYTKEQCMNLFSGNNVNAESEKRNILIFHCEFSAERGPNLYRHLRKEDRQRHASVYPYLSYPEMYLLEGGYKRFFEQYSQLCVPVAYKQMLHPDHEDECRHFRQKSKSSNNSRRLIPLKKLMI